MPITLLLHSALVISARARAGHASGGLVRAEALQVCSPSLDHQHHTAPEHRQERVPQLPGQPSRTHGLEHHPSPAALPTSWGAEAPWQLPQAWKGPPATMGTASRDLGFMEGTAGPCPELSPHRLPSFRPSLPSEEEQPPPTLPQPAKPPTPPPSPPKIPPKPARLLPEFGEGSLPWAVPGTGAQESLLFPWGPSLACPSPYLPRLQPFLLWTVPAVTPQACCVVRPPYGGRPLPCRPPGIRV